MIANTHSGSPSAFPLQRWAQLAVRSVMALTHNSIALVGLAMAALALVLVTRDDIRHVAEERVLSYLLQRQEARNDANAFTPDLLAADRATAAHPSDLPKDQANVALWLSRKYRVAPEPLSVLVAEAFQLGEKIKLDPTLILAVMAIESRFNPFAQSHFGAQGLMQVLTRVHTDKYEDFGGKLAAFDPVTNLRVGVQVLRDCIQRAGSIEGGLSLYVGAVTVDGSDYVNKVMGEHIRLRDVALGKRPAANPIIRTEPRKVQPPTLMPAQLAPPEAESAQHASESARGA
jgi:hypothetical protein